MNIPNRSEYEHPEDKVHYHVGPRQQAGYLNVSKRVASDPCRYLIRDLAWAGCEELERLNEE